MQTIIMQKKETELVLDSYQTVVIELCCHETHTIRQGNRIVL